jgi:D-alanine-D-alanine ligase
MRPSFEGAAGPGGAPLRIALTYDLRTDYLALGYDEEETAEFDQEGTIVAIESTLRALGHEPVRIGNVEALARRLLAGERWELVFNIAEGLHGMGREALVPALLDHYRIPYTFSDPLALALTLHKGAAKQVVRDAGIPTAPFAVLDSAEAIAVDLPYPLFVKPVAEGTGKGITAASIVRTEEQLVARSRELLTRYRQPVLVETYLPGRELTVGVLGTGVDARPIGTLEVVLRPAAEAGVYSFVNKERCEDLVDYVHVRGDDDPVVAEAEDLAVQAWRALGCSDAGRVDLRCDGDGRPLFLEVNPLAGLHPEHSDLPILCRLAGMPYAELLRSIVESAWSRAAAGAAGRGEVEAVAAALADSGWPSR